MDTRLMVRSTDPVTSVMAADTAITFAGTHYSRILSALKYGGEMTAKEIAGATDLTVVQVDRRLPELQRFGSIKLVENNGVGKIREGYRVWEII